MLVLVNSEVVATGSPGYSGRNERSKDKKCKNKRRSLKIIFTDAVWISSWEKHVRRLLQVGGCRSWP